MKANNTNIGPAYSDYSAHLMYIQRTGSPKQREAYRQKLASIQRRGKSLVYVDEAGFR